MNSKTVIPKNLISGDEYSNIAIYIMQVARRWKHIFNGRVLRGLFIHICIQPALYIFN